jgi:hypothetical protein
MMMNYKIHFFGTLVYSTMVRNKDKNKEAEQTAAASLFFGGGVESLGNKLKTGTVTGYLTQLGFLMHENITSLNSSKYFAGIVMITLNLGAKVVSVNFSNSTQEYLKHGASKQLFIFSMAWMGTRDIYTSLILTAVFTVLSEYLLNEDSRFCIVPKQYRMIKTAIDTNNDGVITEQELQSALKVLEKAKTLSKDNQKKHVLTVQ